MKYRYSKLFTTLSDKNFQPILFTYTLKNRKNRPTLEDLPPDLLCLDPPY